MRKQKYLRCTQRTFENIHRSSIRQLTSECLFIIKPSVSCFHIHCFQAVLTLKMTAGKIELNLVREIPSPCPGFLTLSSSSHWLLFRSSFGSSHMTIAVWDSTICKQFEKGLVGLKRYCLWANTLWSRSPYAPTNCQLSRFQHLCSKAQ